MDYHSVHGHDVASFDIPTSSHRLPTVTASAALDELENAASPHISTGLADLDAALATASPAYGAAAAGVKRGQVTEVWGPPGTGKTALGIQLSANAVCDGGSVVWIDCFQALVGDRVIRTMDAVKAGRGDSQKDAADAEAEEGQDQEDYLSRFTQYECLTLAHLMALISRPTSRSLAGDVALVVIDSATALINSALPRSQDVKAGGGAAVAPNKGPPASVKRKQALQSIIKALQTLASTRNCAVVLLSQCATHMQQSGRGATLTPAVNTALWEQGVSTRLVLFRDWTLGPPELGKTRDRYYAPGFLAGVQKLDGRHAHEGLEHVSAFEVGSDGIASIPYQDGTAGVATAPVAQQQPPVKRKRLEVPDSEDDEDYGWADEDESALPPPPPQWQGSEDILLGKEVGQSSDVEGDDEDGESGDEDEDDERASDSE